MSRLDLAPLEDDGDSWLELAARAGVDLGEPSAPFDGWRRDATLELGLYWPAVPPDLEPVRRAPYRGARCSPGSTSASAAGRAR